MVPIEPGHVEELVAVGVADERHVLAGNRDEAGDQPVVVDAARSRPLAVDLERRDGAVRLAQERRAAPRRDAASAADHLPRGVDPLRNDLRGAGNRDVRVGLAARVVDEPDGVAGIEWRVLREAGDQPGRPDGSAVREREPRLAEERVGAAAEDQALAARDSTPPESEGELPVIVPASLMPWAPRYTLPGEGGSGEYVPAL